MSHRAPSNLFSRVGRLGMMAETRQMTERKVMSDNKTIIVAGYGSWAKSAENPAEQILGRLDPDCQKDWRLIKLNVPVVTGELQGRIEKALLDHRPAVWVGLGVAASSAGIRAETSGVNWRAFEVPDNEGVSPDGARIVEGGPAAYDSGLPNRAIVTALRAAGIPAEVSYSAGTHMCNQMLYLTNHLCAINGLATRCGFLHVPLTPQHVARHAPPEPLHPSMDLDMMTRAVTIALDEIVGDQSSSRDTATARVREPLG